MNPWIVAQLSFLALQIVGTAITYKTEYGSTAYQWAARANTPLLFANLFCCAMFFITR